MAQRPDPAPTREGVHFPRGAHRATPDLITIPAKGRRQSERAYRAAYDTDPIVLWERTTGGHLARCRVAGPVSARAWLTAIERNARLRGEPNTACVAIFWDADAPDRSDDRAWVEIINTLNAFTPDDIKER